MKIRAIEDLLGIPFYLLVITAVSWLVIYTPESVLVPENIQNTFPLWFLLVLLTLGVLYSVVVTTNNIRRYLKNSYPLPSATSTVGAPSFIGAILGLYISVVKIELESVTQLMIVLTLMSLLLIVIFQTGRYSSLFYTIVTSKRNP